MWMKVNERTLRQQMKNSADLLLGVLRIWINEMALLSMFYSFTVARMLNLCCADAEYAIWLCIQCNNVSHVIKLFLCSQIGV